MRIIPAIDIIEGKCVRLTKGDYNKKKIYASDPVTMAQKMEDHGIEYLHVVDLDGARAKEIINHQILSDICRKTNLKIDFGGGLKRMEDFIIAFDCGVDQCTAGTVAATNYPLFMKIVEKFGPDKLILGADAKDKKIATNGWEQSSSLDVVQFIRDYERSGIKNVICTDISKDGMLLGPSIQLYKDILRESKVNLIASGGVTTLEDLLELESIGCEGAIIGKALYEGNLTLKEISQVC